MKTIRFNYIVWKARLTERFWLWLAWALPRKLVYFAGIRLWSNATTEQWSHIAVPDVMMDEAIQRWEK